MWLKVVALHAQAAALANDEAELDPLQFRPNPSALVSRLEAPKAGGEAVAGVYRPPKLNPVAMEDDPDRDNNKRKRRAAANQARKSSRNELMRDLAREVEDAPEEVRCHIFLTLFVFAQTTLLLLTNAKAATNTVCCRTLLQIQNWSLPSSTYASYKFLSIEYMDNWQAAAILTTWPPSF